MAEIYCFNLREESRGYAAALCARYRIRMIEVPREKYGLTIRELAAGFPGKSEGEAFEDELLLMDHLDEQQFNGFLDDLRKCTPRYQGLKAVVTRTNRRWTPAALAEELRKERAFVEAQRAKAKEAGVRADGAAGETADETVH